MAKTTKRTTYNVSPAEFIETWERSESVQEVSDKLNMPKPIVLARAANYRKDNLPLKKMKRVSRRNLDIEGLQDLIAKIREEQRSGQPSGRPQTPADEVVDRINTKKRHKRSTN